MNKMHHAFAVLFLVSLGLGASPGSAAADPVESDNFKFTWLGVPIGEVTLHYGRYEDPNRAFGLESICFNKHLCKDVGAPISCAR